MSRWIWTVRHWVTINNLINNELLRFDELSDTPIIPQSVEDNQGHETCSCVLLLLLTPMNDDDVYEVQRLYPQIYIACHTDHVRAVSTKWRISSQDAAILVHLDRESGLRPRELAKHLGISSSTLSAYIARLSELGYLTSDPNKDDGRKREIRLTERGAEALSGTSVLDATRVKAVLKQLKPNDRKDALRGLKLLADAAKKISE